MGDLRALARLVAKKGAVDDDTLNIVVYLITRHTVFTHQDVDRMELPEMVQIFRDLMDVLNARPQPDLQVAADAVDAVLARMRTNGQAG